MARAAQSNVETEDDGPGPDERQSSGTVDRLSPVPAPRIRANTNPEPEEQFDIIEVDDEGNAPNGGTAGSQDERLTEEAGGQRPLIAPDGHDGEGRSRADDRRERRLRQKRAKNNTLQENQALKTRLAELESRLEGTEGYVRQAVEPALNELGRGRRQDQLAQVDAAMAQADADFQAAQREFRDAMLQGADGADAALEALNRRDAAALKKIRLENTKVELEKRPGAQPERRQSQERQQQEQEPQRRQESAPQMGAPAKRFYDKFLDDNSDWFDPNGRDEDSAIAIAVDAQVLRDGYEMNTREYWEELDNRLARRLPHLFGTAEATNGAQPAPRQAQRPDGNGGGQPQPAREAAPVMRRGPMTNGAGERQGGGQRKQVVISPARREAMVMAGTIAADGTVMDQVKFQRTLKQFNEYDRRNGAA